MGHLNLLDVTGSVYMGFCHLLESYLFVHELRGLHASSSGPFQDLIASDLLSTGELRRGRMKDAGRRHGHQVDTRGMWQYR